MHPAAASGAFQVQVLLLGLVDPLARKFVATLAVVLHVGLAIIVLVLGRGGCAATPRAGALEAAADAPASPALPSSSTATAARQHDQALLAPRFTTRRPAPASPSPSGEEAARRGVPARGRGVVAGAMREARAGGGGVLPLDDAEGVQAGRRRRMRRIKRRRRGGGARHDRRDREPVGPPPRGAYS